MSRLIFVILSISPTFYAMVAGGLFSAAVNLLTGMLFSPGLSNMASLVAASLLLCIAGVMLLYVVVRLEDVRSTAANDDRRMAMIRGHVHLFYLVLFSILSSIAAALILIIAGVTGAGGG